MFFSCLILADGVTGATKDWWEYLVSFLIGAVASIITYFLIRLFKPRIKISNKIIKKEDGAFALKVLNKSHYALKQVQYSIYIVHTDSENCKKSSGGGGTTILKQSNTQQYALKLCKHMLTNIRQNSKKNEFYLNACSISFKLEPETTDNGMDFTSAFLESKSHEYYLEFEFYCESALNDTSRIIFKQYFWDDICGGKFKYGNSVDIEK